MNKLTIREKEVLSLLTEGLTNKEIAQRLNLSVHTIKFNLESIYKKLGVTSRIQAAIIAILNA